MNVYVKEGTTNYLKLQQNYILSIYNLTIDTYSDNSESSGDRARIISIDSDSVEIVYAKPTMFNVIKDQTMSIQQILDQNDQISESNKILAMTESAIFTCLSSNLYINNFDFYSEYGDVTYFYYLFRLINPLHKEIKIVNSYIDVTGMILYADKQVEASLVNVQLDLYRTQAGLFFDMTCEDPTVIFNSTLNIINVEVFYSQDRIDLSYRYGPIRYFGAGKIKYENFTANIFTDSITRRILSFHYLDDRCLMEPGDYPLFNITNVHITIPKQDNRNLADVYSPFLTHSFTDKAVNGTQVYITNMTFENMEVYSSVLMTFEIGVYSDIYIRDLTFRNMHFTFHAFVVYNGRLALIENLNIINCTLDRTEIFELNVNDFIITNMTIEGIYGSDDSGASIAIDLNPEITATLQNIHISDIQISKFQSLIRFKSQSSANATISNLTFEEAVVSTPLINFETLANIEMINLKFSNIHKEISNDVSDSMIDLTSISSLVDRNITLSVITIEYSSMSLLKLSNTAQTLAIDQYISISDVSYMHCLYEYSDDLIYYSNIVSDSTLIMNLDQFEFHNITFIRSGNLINFQHQTNNAVVMTNTSISNITYGSIHLKSIDLSENSVSTRVQFNNISAHNIYGKFLSLFSLEQGAEIKIHDSTFNFVSNIFGGSVIYAGYKNAIVNIYDSVFSNNTSTEGGVFLTQSESVIRLYNCTLINNFAVGSGVIKAESNGYYEIYNSHISNNYGYHSAVSEIYSTNIQSVISNTSISNNIALTSEYIQNEFLYQGNFKFDLLV